MALNWNEIKSRALLFSKAWANARNEDNHKPLLSSASVADLYDPLTMPPALRKAHQKRDAAVDTAYQPSGGKKTYASDGVCQQSFLPISRAVR